MSPLTGLWFVRPFRPSLAGDAPSTQAIEISQGCRNEALATFQQVLHHLAVNLDSDLVVRNLTQPKGPQEELVELGIQPAGFREECPVLGDHLALPREAGTVRQQ